MAQPQEIEETFQDIEDLQGRQLILIEPENAIVPHGTQQADDQLQTMPSRPKNIKPVRPRRILNPQTSEEMFVMMEKATKKVKERDHDDALKLNKQDKEAKQKEILDLPKVYVKSSAELQFISNISDFRGTLYVAYWVDDADITKFTLSRPDVDVRSNVLVIFY